MPAYRLKHKPTGLYYIPSRDVKVKTPDGFVDFVKSNLSKKGKIYFSTGKGKGGPTANWRDHYYDHTRLVKSDDHRWGNSYHYVPTLDTYRDEDWELEEVK